MKEKSEQIVSKSTNESIMVSSNGKEQLSDCKKDETDKIEIYNKNTDTGVIVFNIKGVHPHDAASIYDKNHVCIRAGHHCAQPLLNYLGVSAATRASFMFYNTEEEADAFVKSIASIRERMGYGK